MQKAAYEMRISDWSSDGCSSDLRQLRDRFASWQAHPDARNGAVAGDIDGDHGEIGGSPCGQRLEYPAFCIDARSMPPVLSGDLRLNELAPGARKHVGEGQGVSVRCEPGGGRINKKKNNNT